jgi:ribosomal protein L30/L7E
MITYSEIYIQASKELIKLAVKGCKAENLTNGGFVALFHDHHKQEHSQPEWANLGIRYEKYLELKEFSLEKLEALEAEHERILALKFELYEYNDSFFSFAENRTRDTSYQKALTFAPEKLTYKVFDFLSFKGNTVKVDVPNKPFEIHALNKSQIDLLQDVSDYVNASSKLGLEYRDVLKVVEDYVKWTDGRPTGLSYDLKTIEFDYKKILSKRIEN